MNATDETTRPVPLQAAAAPDDQGTEPHARGLERLGVDRDQLVFWLLLTLWVLNVADLLLTHYALWLGFATESNGVMAFFLREGTFTAAAFKLGIVTVGVLVLWRVRYRPTVPFVAALLAAFFAAVVAYQTGWVLTL